MNKWPNERGGEATKKMQNRVTRNIIFFLEIKKHFYAY